MDDRGPRRAGDWFDRAREALDWWSARKATEPTSSLTGGGAVAALERLLGAQFGGWALALPSGSAAIRAGLHALSEGTAGHIELVGDDWFGAAALVRAARELASKVCATPHVELTSWCEASARASRSGVRLCDAANVAPTRYADMARLEWDGLALSFGPGKPIDGGEGGVIVMRQHDHFLRAVRCTQHPIRQVLSGIVDVRTDVVCERIHPMAALVVLHTLSRRW